ncbi:MAG: hypothetical protein WBG30_09330, partial [Psychrilyobacter sp.]|uniref:hypothetical protein n=1 Tax=Psychrilyobacter sp. TaxID=2586924 RepID=UPI003C7860DE
IRKVKSFLIEVKSYLKLTEEKQISLEKRGIISYFYIKHFLYEEFEVLRNFKFHDILDEKFKIIFHEKEKEINLKDINIINYLLIKAVDIESVDQVFLIFRGEKIDALEVNKLYKEILETEEPLFEKKGKLFHRTENVSELRTLFQNKINGFKLTEDIQKKLLIFFLFDYYFYEWNNLSENLRHNENINHTVKKLNSWSLDDLSKINCVLNKLKSIFEIQEIEERKKQYLASRVEAYTNKKSIYYIGGNEWEEIMRELSRDEKIKYSKSIIELMFYSEQSLNNNILKVLSDEKLYYNNKKNWLFIMKLFIDKEVKEKLYKPLAEDTIRKIIKFIIYNRYDVNFWKNDMILQDYYSEGTQKMIEEIKTNLTSHYPLEEIDNSLKEELKIIYNFLDKAKDILDNQFTVKKADTFKVEIKDGGLERAKEIEELKRKENIDINKLYSQGELTPNEYIELFKIKKS